MKSREDRCFDAFRRTGSPRALGSVYDLVADELLRVAQHLAQHDPLAAEDLVQQTFLTAIERAASFEAGARVRPWLLGILAHHAKNQRRRVARGAGTSHLFLEDVPQAESVAGPHSQAQQEELERHVEKALAALPEAWRPVVALRVRHGLTAAEIARVLGRPPGTVRSQMARGLASLREHLPRSLVGAGLLSTLVPRGLAALREDVLARAEILRPPLLAVIGAQATALLAPLVPVAWLLPMNKLAISGIAVLSAALWVGFATQQRTITPALSPNEAKARSFALAGVERSSEDPLAQAAPAPASEPERKRESADQASTALATPASGALRIRVVDAYDAPVPGEPCRLSRWIPATGWMEERVATTDERGVAVFAELPPDSFQASLLRAGRETVQVQAGQEHTLEMRIEEGLEVRGEVVDGSGRPIPGAGIRVFERPGLQQSHVLTHADPAGRFSLHSITKDHYLGAEAPGFAASYVQTLSGEAGDRIDLRIVLDALGGRVEGRVVDASGTPLSGAEVLVDEDGQRASRVLPGGRAAPGPPARRTKTGQDGRFELASVGVGEQELQVRAIGYGPLRRLIDVPPRSTAQVVLELLAGGRLEGEVTDAAGRPVALAQVFTEPRYRFASVGTVTDAEGRFSLASLPAEEVPVVAHKAPLGVARAHLVLLPGETRSFDFRLEPSPSIFGSVRSAEGEPLAGWIVAARHEETRAVRDSSTTDERGIFHLEVDAERHYTLLVMASDGWTEFPRAVSPHQRSSKEPITLVVPRLELATGTLRATVLDPDGAPAGGACMTVTSEALGIGYRFDVDRSTGRLDVTGIPRGILELRLRHPDHPTLALESITLEAGEVRDLGELRFAPSGRIRGSLLGLDGDELVAGLEMGVSRSGSTDATIERAGREFQSSPLEEGEYQLWLRGELVKPIDRSVTILPGQEVLLQLELERAGLRIVRLDASALPNPPLWVACQVRDEQGRYLWSPAAERLSDGDFEARISVPPGRYVFTATTPDGATAESELEVLGLDGAQEPLRVALRPSER